MPEILNFDNNDAYDSYVRTRNAPALRERGKRIQANLEAYHEKVDRAADLTGKEPRTLHLETLMKNPQAISHIANYVGNRGYTPSSNIPELCAQCAHAWDEHISETQDHYDPENYDADNFGFGKAKGKAKRKAKRAKRKERRKARRTRRKAKKAARKARKHKGGEDASDVAEATSTAEEKQAEDTQAEVEATQAAAEAENTDDTPVQTEAEEVPDGSEAEELSNPDDVEAEAENFGEMFDSDGYDGEGYDEMPLYYASALEVGRHEINDMRNNIRAGNYDGFDFSKIGKLFKKDGAIGKLFKKGTPVGDLASNITLGDAAKAIQAGKKSGLKKGAKEAINATVKELGNSIEKKKKVDFLKANAIYIVIALVVLVMIGRASAKS